ncbi:Pirin domain protein [Thiorhodococcus drewsii AZ1]|uniref:Pirin domain protein n=1 Tax=Thiorhodococcus drewsii AZ1 TaxID=765913 RepID=G2DZI6_9GAMM|nr:pirin family protein [Thiorhodococcus drewsii]EGV32213.1 Pirin domain protein [Thiorhodococcus drewsii AZ1]
MNRRSIERILTAVPASDGGGVSLYRILGPDGMRGLDPFLMLDDFGSDSAEDYIAGFPPHPHRGFETVTYMLQGHMLHEDHLGNRGVLASGGVQWMTAGRGVIHSEMPQQDSGSMHGFQLWLNLPASEKMKDPAYRNLPAEEIPEAILDDGIQVKVVAGDFAQGDAHLAGPAQGIATDPLYLDLSLPADARLELPIQSGHRALVYLIEGEILLDDRNLVRRQMAVFDMDGECIALSGGPGGARALVLAARPLGEPIVHHGPFVMNTRDQIRQAIRDYESGRLTG